MHATRLVEWRDYQLTVDLRRRHLRIDRRCRLRLRAQIPFSSITCSAGEIISQWWAGRRHNHRRGCEVEYLSATQIKEVRPRRKNHEIRSLHRHGVVAAGG